MVESIAEGFWQVPRPLTIATLAIGTRMHVLCGADGRLHLVSPVDVDDDEQRAIDALGKVASVVVPNTMHTMYWRKAHARWPGATLYAPEKVRAAAKDVSWAATSAPSDAAIDAQRFEGAASLDETVFFHRPSATVVFTDLVFHFTEKPGWWTGWYVSSQRVLGRVGQTIISRSTISDKGAARRSAARVAEWEGARIAVCHAANWSGDTRDAVKDAFAWLG